MTYLDLLSAAFAELPSVQTSMATLIWRDMGEVLKVLATIVPIVVYLTKLSHEINSLKKNSERQEREMNQRFDANQEDMAKQFATAKLLNDQQFAVVKESLAELKQSDERLAKAIQDVDVRLTKRMQESDERLAKAIQDVDVRLTKRIQEGDERLAKAIQDVDVRLTKRMQESDERLAKAIQDVDVRLTKRMQESDGRLAKAIQDVDDRLTKRIQEGDERLKKSIEESVAKEFATAKAFTQQQFDFMKERIEKFEDTTNQQFTKLEIQLDEKKQQLAKLETQFGATNQQLAKLETQFDEMKQQLAKLYHRLAVLNKSLREKYDWIQMLKMPPLNSDKMLQEHRDEAQHATTKQELNEFTNAWTKAMSEVHQHINILEQKVAAMAQGSSL